MKIGACTRNIEHSIIAKEIGFDYVELNFSAIAKMSDDKFKDYYAEIERHDIHVEAYNCFFPSDITIYNEDSLENTKKYAQAGFERVSHIGGKIAVIGSAGARSIPDNVDPLFAHKRFSDIIGVCADIADKYNMKVVVEPLNRKETNFIHTVAEGAEISRLSGRSNAGVLVDFYHFFMNEEKDDGLISSKDILFHAHMARPNKDRGVPTDEDMPTIAKWAGMLRDIGYDARISMECHRGDNIVQDLLASKKALDIFKRICYN